MQEYVEADRERRLPEVHQSERSDFARDRARLVHSSALRRLAAKTQVLSPTAGLDFARTRLTHSLEVAQIGREIAVSLGVDADLVDTACLAHDLGHPPFGHNGEAALDAWAGEIGGFEGNAQTFRLLTRLEPKVFSLAGESFGLNLSRATLDAASKYPWPRSEGKLSSEGRVKFGVYDDDLPAFTWMRYGVPVGRVCIEAQIMDLADDLAYSVHDFEDAIVSGHIDLGRLLAKDEQQSILISISNWSGGEFDVEELESAFLRLRAHEQWLTSWDAGRRAHARLKNFTSQLIGRFAQSAIAASKESFAGECVTRYRASVVVPRETRAEIAVLKGVVAAFLMSHGSRQGVYAEQRELLCELADRVFASGDVLLEPMFVEDWKTAQDDRARRRVVVDQIANLTDQSAYAWRDRLLT